VKVAGAWRPVGSSFVKVAGVWRNSTLGKPPAKPVMQYAGSGTTNMGKFRIVNYQPSADYTLVYQSGDNGGNIVGDLITITGPNAIWNVVASWGEGAPLSDPGTVERKAPWQTSVPYTSCYNPCGDCRTDVNPHTWSCGCGSGCNDSGGGQWGDCICRGPGYSYWTDARPQGYTWGGTDYTNGQGEWYKVA
jgi:hypothetical protein